MTRMSALRHTVAVTAVLTVLGSGVPYAMGQSRIDQPMAVAWPAAHAWSVEYETRFGEFVAAIGRAVRDGRCRTLAGCLNDPSINPLYEPGARPLRLRADCADVPYVLRAYFAYRHQLPFAWARRMRGRGRDARYLSNARPEGLRVWTEYATPRALLQSIGSEVHSGYFRTAPEVENSDFYQAAIAPGAIRPGTVYYDPNGHVLMVYHIREDGEVLMFDGHPDNSVTHSRLARRHVIGRASQGGGFKNFRPIVWDHGTVVQLPNAAIADFGGRTPFDRSGFVVSGQRVSFEEWVRARLGTVGGTATRTGTRGTPIQGALRTTRTRGRRVHPVQGRRPAALPCRSRRCPDHG